jgi:hypothetical protein
VKRENFNARGSVAKILCEVAKGRRTFPALLANRAA